MNKNNKQITQRLRCELTDEEKLNAGKELADATTALHELEETKAQVTAQFKAEATSHEANIAVFSNKLRSGYEFRQVNCILFFDEPEPGKKQVVRMDTRQIVSTEEMTEDEKQRELELVHANQNH